MFTIALESVVQKGSPLAGKEKEEVRKSKEGTFSKQQSWPHKKDHDGASLIHGVRSFLHKNRRGVFA